MDLVGAEVPEQKLSLLSGLSKTQKEKVVESLVAGNIKLLKHPEKQSADNYSLMRKFALILLKDIMNERNSLVFSTFEPLLNQDKLNTIRHHFNRDNEVKPDDDINVSTDQSKSLITAVKRGLTYPPVNNGIIQYNIMIYCSF